MPAGMGLFIGEQMNGLKLDSALAILRRSNIELAAPPGSPDYLQQVIDGLVTVIAIDPLTGLGNRRRLDEELERQSQLVKRAKFVSVLVADLDGFKCVNDSHGHDIGDSVLRQAAVVRRSSNRPGQRHCNADGRRGVCHHPP